MQGKVSMRGEENFEHFDVLGFDKSPVLVEIGLFEEAADSLFQHGDTIEAIKLICRVIRNLQRQRPQTPCGGSGGVAYRLGSVYHPTIPLPSKLYPLYPNTW